MARYMAKERATSKKYHDEYMKWFKVARKESAAKRKEYLTWLKGKKKEAIVKHRAFEKSTAAYSRTLGYEKDDPRYKKYMAKYKKTRWPSAPKKKEAKKVREIKEE